MRLFVPPGKYFVCMFPLTLGIRQGNLGDIVGSLESGTGGGDPKKRKPFCQKMTIFVKLSKFLEFQKKKNGQNTEN